MVATLIRNPARIKTMKRSPQRFRALAVVIAYAGTGLAASSLWGLPPAERATTHNKDLVEGVDYTIAIVGEAEVMMLKDLICHVPGGRVNCNDLAWPCAYLPAGASCTFCDGGGNAAGWCTPDPGEDCTEIPASSEPCGKQGSGVCVAGVCTGTVPVNAPNCWPKRCQL